MNNNVKIEVFPLQNGVFEVHITSKTRTALEGWFDRAISEKLKEFNVHGDFAYDLPIRVFPVNDKGEYTENPTEVAGYKKVAKIYTKI